VLAGVFTAAALIAWRVFVRARGHASVC